MNTPGDRLFRELQASNWWISIPQIEAFIAGVNRVVAEEVAKERERCAAIVEDGEVPYREYSHGPDYPDYTAWAKLIRETK